METGKVPEAFTSKEEGADLNINCNETTRHGSSDKSKPENHFKSRTCSYFYKYGYCKFGSNCKYKHYRKSVEKRVSKNPKTPVSQIVRENKQAENKDLQNSNAKTASKENCKYFMLGDCKKGDNCEYIHSIDFINNQMTSFTISSESQNIPRKVYSSNNRALKRRTLCYYFKKGLCHKGDTCRYYHPNKSHLINSENLCNFKTESNDDGLLLPDKTITFVSESSSVNKNRSNFRRTFNIFDLSTLTADALTELRTTEINQLKKRFPQFEIISENQTYCILFQPSDPDWAFDVKKLKLAVEFPEKYPTEKCIVSVIRSAENIPLILIKHLNTAIYEWIEKKFEENRTANKTELMFRSFLRWFDKSLEDLFITGLKKVKQDIKAKEAGIEFVPLENLFSSPTKACAETNSDNNSFVLTSSQQPNNQISDSDSKDSSSQTVQDRKPAYCSSNNGMKITFTNLELIEGAAAMTCTKISVTLQCSRCRTSFNMKSAHKKSNSHICSKCSKNVGFTFESMTIHEFSSALGTLHLLDCIAVDVNLVECYFLVDCLNCSQQVSVDGIHYGQKHKMWCTFCNQKMLISIGSVKFQAQNLTSFQAKYVAPKKIEKKFKDPIVKEGEPLPDFGACKHYKKSFRWLRFPCCGRLYACDECHDEKETDHEMKYASRMVCGFCAKEQPYSREKPCLNCSQDLTRKSGSHWEGGKGCRNKIQMSREDKQKYSGISKTMSKRAQNNKPKKKI